ncbi:MAG: DUF4214 domain-containing protein [Ruthenibacterium sp.]
MKLKRTIAMLLVAGMMLSIVPAFAADDNSLAPVAPATETQIVEAPVETPVTPPAETPVAPPAASASAPASASSEASVPASSTASSTAASSEVPVPSSSTSEDIIVAPDSTSALPQGELVDGGVADLGEDGAAPEVLDANDEKLTAFMTRLYKSCFDREPDAGGLAAWVGYLKKGMSGTDVTVHFFHSQEFSNLNTIDTEFLNKLYFVVFNRAVDPSGAESWIRAMADEGLSRDWVLSNVLASPEFANVCRDYGIQQGSYKSTQPRDQNPLITKFVNRMYSVFLGRKGEEGGLNAWCGVFLNRTMTGTNFAYELSRSQEFLNRKLDDVKYINVLYNAAFGRDAENAGLAAWLLTLDQGMSREYVLNGIINSIEFSNICREYGVVQGKYEVTQPRDKDPKQTYFVNNLYKSIFGRQGDEGGLNTWTLAVQKGASGSSLIKNFLGTAEFTNRRLSNQEIVEVLFKALFDRSATGSDLINWGNKLNTYTVQNVAEQMMKVSKEFQEYCKRQNINAGLGGTLKVTANGQVIQGEAEDVLSCIVNGEIGGFANTGFNTRASIEAFKAQAVAAYTWIQYQYAHGNPQPTVAYLANPSSTIRDAVRDVLGVRVLYNGAPALTTYFASCAGRTNSAASVWGSTDLPYLAEVASPYDGISENRNYEVTRVLDEKQMEAIGNKVFGGSRRVKYYSNRADWLTVTSADSNHYVRSVRYGLEWHKDSGADAGWYKYPSTNGNYFVEKANEAVKIEGGCMRSPAFTVKYNGNRTWSFHFWGYGHGVGMSQWGAYGYAKDAGWNYQQILQHYYPGTTLAS